MLSTRVVFYQSIIVSQNLLKTFLNPTVLSAILLQLIHGDMPCPFGLQHKVDISLRSFVQ